MAAIGALRALRFRTVRGFDALSGTQDLGTGLQIAALGGPSLHSDDGRRDVFLSGSLFWGVGGSRSFVRMLLVAEGRRFRDTQAWQDVVANGRLTWYVRPGEFRTRTLTVEYSAIRHLAFPLQLTFRDHEGGLHGHADARLAGGTRAIARLEDRWVFRPFGPTAADVATAWFAEAGALWPGDVPYGRSSGLRGAVGVSLLGAYPAGGKRTYRVDLAVPVSSSAGAKWELRLTSADRTRVLWQEPGDVARARAGAVPANLLGWLPR
jgi:hypothetical protein